MTRALVLAGLVALAASPAAAQDPAEPPDAVPRVALSWRTSLKASLLGSHAPDAPALYPERDSAASFWRARFEPTLRFGGEVTLTAAYEQRLQVVSGTSGLGLGHILPTDTPAPFRVRQLDWAIVTQQGLAWRHEVDRASLAWHRPGINLTIGRQAIGWGRGVMFGAVDLFAPFTPLEADREWRRGIDAVRVEVPLADRVSVDGVAAFGDSADASAFAGRLRGYAGRVDLEVMGGRRGRDLFGGVTSSAAVGAAEVHGEAAVFRASDAGPLGAVGRTVVKAVAGASHRFGVGPGVLTFVEYHYSGFGVERPGEIVARLGDPALVGRLLRGDMQIVGRHALAVLASSELSPELSLGAQWLHSPTDASGVVTPTSTVSFGDAASLVMSLYVPYGRRPAGVTLRSEYGGTPLSAFLQLRIYR